MMVKFGIGHVSTNPPVLKWRLTIPNGELEGQELDHVEVWLVRGTKGDRVAFRFCSEARAGRSGDVYKLTSTTVNATCAPVLRDPVTGREVGIPPYPGREGLSRSASLKDGVWSFAMPVFKNSLSREIDQASVGA